MGPGQLVLLSLDLLEPQQPLSLASLLFCDQEVHPLRLQLWYGVTGGHSQNTFFFRATHHYAGGEKELSASSSPFTHNL
jgi:hypothetical protein